MALARRRHRGSGGAALAHLARAVLASWCWQADPVDAVAIARITAREASLPPVRLRSVRPRTCALADYRRQLTEERTALANRTHAELHGLHPGYHADIPRLTAPRYLTGALAMLDGDTPGPR